MQKFNLRRRSAQIAVAAGMIGAMMAATATPALAGKKILDRAGCLWTAGSYVGYAYTKPSSANDCSGHGWVRIRLNGDSGYSGWTHSADTFDGARQGAPAGRSIVSSQHKTCSDCDVTTLTP